VEVLATVSAHLADNPGAHELEELDHRPLVWHGAVDLHPTFVTRLNIAPGVSREVEFLFLGRTTALFELFGWSLPLESAVLGGAGDRWVMLESAAFAARPFPEAGSGAFLQEHLVYRIRFDVTARNIDTAAYEAELRVRYEWKDSVMSAAPILPKPSRWSDAKKQRVRVYLEWSRYELKSG
jgi:hypothetical protein